MPSDGSDRGINQARLPDDDDRDDELWKTVGPGDHSDAMPGPIVEAIRSHDAPRTNGAGIPETGVLGDYMLPRLKLPGFDGENHDDCGDELPHACKCCGSVVGVGRTCAESTCERCATAWCRERASAWAARLMQLKAYRYAVTGDDQFYHHLTVSPPDGWLVDEDEPRKAGRSIVRSIMQELGVEGVAVYHPWRGKDEQIGDESHPRDAYPDDSDTDDDRGEWQNRLFEGRDWDGDVRDELRFSPHYHVVCVGGWVRGGQLTEAVHEATGWVIHRITPDDPEQTHSIRDDRALARVLAYVHSHAGIRETDAGNHRVETTRTGEHLTGGGRERFEVSQATEERADRLVREEAWKVLGIPSADMTCHEDHLQPPEDDDETVRAGDGDGDDAGGDGEHHERCKGALVPINKRDPNTGELYWEQQLEDDDWTDDARYPVQVREALDEWRDEQQPDRAIWDAATAG